MKECSIHFITGGQRSGKSEFAEKVVLEQTETPVYLATSKHWDDEHSKRIKAHQERRRDFWTTLEEPLNIGNLNLNNKTVLLDCITLWLTNIFDHFEYNPEDSLEFALSQWNLIIKQRINLTVVSNEIGLGVVPIEKSTRQFLDIHGKLNQHIAGCSTVTTMVVAGIPVRLK